MRPIKLKASSSTKERILLAAQEEFALLGFAGATTRGIARRAKVNNSTLHYHWNTKEELYTAVFKHLHQEILRGFKASMKEFGDYDFAIPEARRLVIARLIEILMDFMQTHPHLPRLFAQRWLQEESYRVAVEKEFLSSLMTQATQALEFLRAKGWVRPIDPELFILTMDRIIFGYFIGLNSQNQFLGGNIMDDGIRTRIHKHLLSLFLSYLGWE